MELTIREIKDPRDGAILYHLRVNLGDQIHWNTSVIGTTQISEVMKLIKEATKDNQ